MSESDLIPGLSTHIEFTPTNILSIVANMTPFSDYNQSPRNMYQCQMSKQTMGTPGTSIAYRTDNKLYRIQTGQTPIVRPPLYNAYGLDNFPNGMNAVVAIISYTGYDMDDAMIINKSAHERGFGHGTIYKTKVHTLAEERLQAQQVQARCHQAVWILLPATRSRQQVRAILDDDGLPHMGARVKEGDKIAAWHNVRYRSCLRLVCQRRRYHSFHEVQGCRGGIHRQHSHHGIRERQRAHAIHQCQVPYSPKARHW